MRTNSFFSRFCCVSLPSTSRTDAFSRQESLAKKQMIAAWETWAKQAEPGRGENRETTVFRLRSCLERGAYELELEDLNLTELPPHIPDTVIRLYASRNQLTHLPDRLPPSLEILYVSHNQLTKLPEHLPSSLCRLSVINNQLTYLPEQFPSELKTLFVSQNQLTTLPENLPKRLKTLDCSLNHFAHLPNILPSNLKTLNVDNNQLMSLPPSLPPRLENLNIASNNFTELTTPLPLTLETLNISYNRFSRWPAQFPPNLERLHASYNNFTELPSHLPDTLERLDLDNNQISELHGALPSNLTTLNMNHNLLTWIPDNLPSGLRYLHVFENQIFHPPRYNPEGPTLLGIAHNPCAGRSYLTFDESKILCLWNPSLDSATCKSISQEENAPVFFNFLKRLHIAKNTTNQQLKQIVSGWLKELLEEKNIELRRETFAVAKEGTESCVDRASYYFNQMYALMIEHRLRQNDAPISEIFHALLSLFRLQELETIAAAHVEQRKQTASGFIEDIEIFLAYQYYLRKELDLPIYTELQFSSVAQLTQAHLDKAKDKIKEEEQQYFIRYLVNNSSVWKQKITDWSPEKINVAEEAFREKVDQITFGESGADFYNIYGKNKIDELHYAIFFPLTRAFLEEKEAFSLLHGFVY